MSRLIEFLERAGYSASFNSLSQGEYSAAVSNLGLSHDESRALLDRDAHALSLAAGGRANMICMIAVPDEEVFDAGDGVDAGAAAFPSIN